MFFTRIVSVVLWVLVAQMSAFGMTPSKLKTEPSPPLGDGTQLSMDKKIHSQDTESTQTSSTASAETADLPFVFVIGDSISLQYGPFLKQALEGSYRYERLSGESEAMRNLDVPAGGNGGDSDRVLVLLQALLKNPGFRPDVMLLNCGLHDIKRDGVTDVIQVPLSRYQENLEAMVRSCRAAGVQMVWVRTTEVVDAIHSRNRNPTSFQRRAVDQVAYNECADAVMRANQVPVIDLDGFTRSLGDAATVFKDHVHFTEDVQQEQGAFIAEHLVHLQKSAAKKTD